MKYIVWFLIGALMITSDGRFNGLDLLGYVIIAWTGYRLYVKQLKYE